MGEICLDAPAGVIQLGQCFERISLGIHQRRDERDLMHPRGRGLDAVPQLAHPEPIGQRGELALRYPSGALFRLEPLDHLILDAQRLEPARARQALVALLAATGTGMRPLRPKVDDLPLMEAKDAVHFLL